MTLCFGYIEEEEDEEMVELKTDHDSEFDNQEEKQDSKEGKQLYIDCFQLHYTLNGDLGTSDGLSL